MILRFLLWVYFMLLVSGMIRLWYHGYSHRRKCTRRSIAILVLGDIGRSPRMMYHAESFSKAQFDTHLIGYRGSKEIPSLREIKFVYLPDPPLLPNLPFVLLVPLKVIHQVVTILAALMLQIPEHPEFILVQNPPSIPSLALVWMVGRIIGCKVIIDWHNLGHSILAMKLGRDHPFVCLSERFERIFGRSAYAHLFVTHAMHDHLVKEWDLRGRKVVLYDRPPQHFHKASPPEIHELFLRIREALPASLYSSFFPGSSSPYCTPFTHIKTTATTTATTSSSSSSSQAIESTAMPSTTISSPPTFPRLNMPTLRPDRPALLVSSTSWTPDEDFSILLQALCLYEKRAREMSSAAPRGLPKILVVITGKGPLREKYMQEVDRLQCEGGGEGGWRWVRCINMWLEAEDYPLLLGSADLGVCLHSSSSGMDLPMKVVDMFGCGLPVCALDFACLDELVKDGKNGLVFKNAEQLAQQLENLLTSFPDSEPLAALRSSLVRNSLQITSSSPYEGEGGGYLEWSTWEENWERVVRPLLRA